MCTLVHTFITSRVDYCNAVLYGVPAKVTRRLQAVLHAAARLITGVRRNQHITATLRDTLHWLPVYLSAFCSMSPWWRLTVFVVKDQALWWCPSVSSHCQSSCTTAICRSRWNGRPAFVHNSFRPAPLPLICTICVERPFVSELKNSDISRRSFKPSLKAWLFERAYS